jgi:hypothetical protein
MKLDRCETISGSYKEEARNLCAFIIEYLPSGTVEEFTKISGANMEKIFDVGNEAFAER